MTGAAKKSATGLLSPKLARSSADRRSRDRSRLARAASRQRRSRSAVPAFVNHSSRLHGVYEAVDHAASSAGPARRCASWRASVSARPKISSRKRDRAAARARAIPCLRRPTRARRLRARRDEALALARPRARRRALDQLGVAPRRSRSPRAALAASPSLRRDGARLRRSARSALLRGQDRRHENWNHRQTEARDEEHEPKRPDSRSRSARRSCVWFTSPPPEDALDHDVGELLTDSSSPTARRTELVVRVALCFLDDRLRLRGVFGRRLRPASFDASARLWRGAVRLRGARRRECSSACSRRSCASAW